MLGIVLPKTDNKILWLVRILLAACLALPLFTSSSLLFPYTSAKAFAFRIIIEFALPFYVYLCLKYRDFRPRPNLLVLAVLSFLATWFLSAVLGVGFYLSFWGNLERMGGVFGLAHFALFFLMLASVYKKYNDWLWLLRISVSTSALVSLLAIFQRFTSLGLTLPQQVRVASTIGNPAYLAGYLIFNIFFAVYLLFVRNRQAPGSDGRPQPSVGSKSTRLLYGGIILLQLVAFVLAGTRGAMLGLTAGLIFCLIYFARSYPQPDLKKYFLGCLILILALAGLVFVFRGSPVVKNNSILSRLSNFSLNDTTAKNRLILWQVSWQAWQAKPIFGWGPENFETAANKYFDQRLNPYEAWYDRAHNFVFDDGVTTGWLGLTGFLALIAIIFYNLIIISRTSRENFILAVVFGGLLIAYLTQNLFVFDSFVSFLMLFFILALVNNYNPALSKVDENSKKNAVAANPPFIFGKKILVLALSLAAVYLIYYLNIQPMQASAIGNEILSLAPDQAGQATALASEALAKNTFASDEIIYQTTIDYISKIQIMPQLTGDEDFYQMASAGLKKAISGSDQQARYYVALAWLDLYFSGGHADRGQEAITLAEKAQKLSQEKKDTYLILVAAYSLAGDDQKAQMQVVKAQAFGNILGSEIKDYYNSLNQK